MAIPRSQELTELLTFKATGPSIAAAGNIATEGATITTAYARMEEMGGTIGPLDQQHQEYTQDFEIWVRYDTLITAWLQIEWGTRTLVITQTPQQVVDTNNRRWLLIRAQETIERSL